jgi:hypothetical protein
LSPQPNATEASPGIAPRSGSHKRDNLLIPGDRNTLQAVSTVGIA